MRPIAVIEALANLVGDRGVVSGGCCRDAYLGETPKDYDVFIYNEDDLHTIADKLGAELKYRDAANTHYSFTLKGRSVQLIYGKCIGRNPIEAVSSFPFTVNQFWYDGKLLATKEAKEALDKKVLVFNNQHKSGLSGAQTIRTFLVLRAAYLAKKLGLKLLPSSIEKIYRRYP